MPTPHTLQAIVAADRPLTAIIGVRAPEPSQASAAEAPAPSVEPITAAVGPAAGAESAGPGNSRPDTGGGGLPEPSPDLAPTETAAPDTLEPVVFEPARAAAAGEAAAVPDTPASTPRATPDTVASLAAEVARKLDARVSRFDLTLTPEGLGSVQVSLEIRDGGQVSAQLSFDRPEAAAELRARSAELRSALEGAGFSVSAGGLSFDSAGSGRDQAFEPPAPPARPGMFTLADEAAAPPPVIRSRPASRGVDLRI